MAGVLRAIEDGMYSPALTERVRSLIDMVVLTPEAEASRLVGERHCGLASILSLCETIVYGLAPINVDTGAGFVTPENYKAVADLAKEGLR